MLLRLITKNKKKMCNFSTKKYDKDLYHIKYCNSFHKCKKIDINREFEKNISTNDPEITNSDCNDDIVDNRIDYDDEFINVQT